MKIAVIILRMLGKNPSRFGKNGDIDLASIAKETFPTHAKINVRSVMAIKDAASSCHASQGGSRMRAGVMGWYRMLFGGIEYFMREYPPIGKGEKTGWSPFGAGDWPLRTVLLSSML